MTDKLKINTIMIIDDDNLDQLLYKRIINRSIDVEKILTFQSAIDALAYLKSSDREAIDVIFLDINMPKMNGFEFLERATSELGCNFAGCVIVMLTTSLNPADEERAKSFKAVKAYLSKPLTEEDLEEVARLVISRDE